MGREVEEITGLEENVEAADEEDDHGGHCDFPARLGEAGMTRKRSGSLGVFDLICVVCGLFRLGS